MQTGNAMVTMTVQVVKMRETVATVSVQKHLLNQSSTAILENILLIVLDTCGIHEFQCDNHRCIPESYKCDHEYDCGFGDKSDESDATCMCCHLLSAL